MPNTKRLLLLDIMCEFRVKIHHLFDPDFEVAFNRRHRGFSDQDLKQALDELSSTGYVMFMDIDHSTDKVSKISVKEAVELDENWYISLTDKGGICWEEMYCPNWIKYIDVTSQFDVDSEIVTIKCGERETIDELVEIVEPGSRVALRSTTEVISPWHVTYWKTIERGYKIEIRGSDGLLNYISENVPEERWRNPA